MPQMRKTCYGRKAVEAGNIFKLGTKYSEAFNLTYTDEQGKENLITMGCYGIGTTRLMGTIVEASYDEKGIIWPDSVRVPNAFVAFGQRKRIKRCRGKIV